MLGLKQSSSRGLHQSYLLISLSLMRAIRNAPYRGMYCLFAFAQGFVEPADGQGEGDDEYGD